jgi:hypothetical protein
LAVVECTYPPVPAAIQFLAAALVQPEIEPFQERLGGRLALGSWPASTNDVYYTS